MNLNLEVTKGADFGLTAIKFARGPHGDPDGLWVELPSLTVLVGPNSSGKTQALREILGATHGAPSGVVIDVARFEVPDSPARLADLLPETYMPDAGQYPFRRPGRKTNDLEYKNDVGIDQIERSYAEDALETLAHTWPSIHV